MPAGMPIRNAITIAMPAPCMVTGSFCAIRLSTGTLMRSDSPKSPDSTPLTQYKYCTGIGRSSRYCLRICAITSGSRSSPAITSAGSPGSRCCSEKIRIDTKNSVGISCSRRLVRKFSIGRYFGLSSSSLELQPDDAHQPVRDRLVAFELRGVGDQVPAVIDIDDRLVLEDRFRHLLVDLFALRQVGHEPGIVERLVDVRVGIGAVVLRRLGLLEDIGVAVRIDPAAPVEDEGLIFAGFGLLERGGELGDPDPQIE